jgi:uncharacterized protein YciI
VIAVVFRRGPAWDAERPIVEQAGLDGHLRWVRRHRDEAGPIIQAGPFHDPATRIDDDLVGLCLLDLESLDEARELVEQDPVVRTGAYGYRLYPWGGKSLHRSD